MIYRFKVWFEDLEDIVRWIDIKPSHNFLDFHNIIQEAIGFDKKEFSSFYISDDKWRKHMEISLEDMKMSEENDTEIPSVLMKDSRLRDFINDPHQRFVYVTDFMANWTLFCELLSINDEQAKKDYPLLYKSEGKAPRQREDSKFKLLDENEFDALAAKILASKGAKDIMEGAEEELVAAVDTDDESDGEEEKEDFGFDEFSSGSDDVNLEDGFTELS
jgi:hypothetical protein